MNRNHSIVVLLMMALFGTQGCKAQTVDLLSKQPVPYTIVIPAEASRNDSLAMRLMKKMLKQSTGIDMAVVSEAKFNGTRGIYIGKTAKGMALGEYSRVAQDGFMMVMKSGNLFISGKHGHASEYGVYRFVEQFMGGRKWDATPAYIPKTDKISIPGDLSQVINPAFLYRQSYYTMSNDAEYLNWYGLHRFDDLWGLWGHSYFKLVPPAQYFKTHPEYFSEINGQRKAVQLCLSQPDVLKIVVAQLKARMADNPDMEYWSVSPNDGGGNCQCALCKKADQEEGSASGSLIRFVNKVAKAFPDKTITTLAYGYTAKAPEHTKPESNVVVMLSTIDAFREKPLKEIASAADFRSNLAQWRDLGSRLFVWDYSTQFTSYIAPFPVADNFQPDYTFFKENNISGIFEQGSGDTYSDMDALYSYLQAKLLWDPKADAAKLTEDFCNGYYGAGGPFVLQYIRGLKQQLAASQKHLDIYGNPINERNSFLSPASVAQYTALLDKAKAAVSDPLILKRIARLNMGLDYVKLQQSRHFGPEENGFLQQDAANTKTYTVKPQWAAMVAGFTRSAKEAGVTELSEGGLNPDQYQAESNSLLAKTWPKNLIYDAKVTLQNPFADDYPAKGNHTLVDGMTGFDDFSYNWLCFYGSDMVASIDCGKQVQGSKVELHFLDDPRHWIFLPKLVNIAGSADGEHYTTIGEEKLAYDTEHDDIRIRTVSFKAGTPFRYLKITAQNPVQLPAWRAYGNKKAMIACDEVMVLP